MHRGRGIQVVALFMAVVFLTAGCTATKSVRTEKGKFVKKEVEKTEINRQFKVKVLSPMSAKVYEEVTIEERKTLYFNKKQITETVRPSFEETAYTTLLCGITGIGCLGFMSDINQCKKQGYTKYGKNTKRNCTTNSSVKVIPNEYDIKVTDPKITHKEIPVPNTDIAVYIDDKTKAIIKTNNEGIAKIDIGKYPVNLSGKEKVNLVFRYGQAYDISEIPAAQYAKAINRFKKRNIPSDLTASINFTDEEGHTPNNIIDAVEESVVYLEIKNKGKGVAYNVEILADTDYSGLDVSKSINIGNIMPGDTKKATISLKAGKSLKGGKVPLFITLAEERGYDWKKKILLPASGLEKPSFTIDYEINDGSRGLAKGNGNGIPENGETIELTAFIKNQGDGDAVGVVMRAVEINQGLTWEKNKEHIGRIHPGETVKAKAAFSIPINFDTEKIIASLNLKDSRGISSMQKEIELEYSKRIPELHYDYRIMSGGKEVSSVTNGEDFRIGITVTNSGSLKARDVSMSLESGKDIRINQKKTSLGIIEAQSPLPTRDISISVPRDYIETSLPITVFFSQSDFPGHSDVIKIPVVTRKPSLTYMATLLSRDAASLQQGETADLEITILNDGDLKAEGVTISLTSNNDHLRIPPDANSRTIGSIPAKSASETIKFRVSATKRLKAGSLPLDIKIKQKDFSTVADQYAMNITEEQIATIDFTSGSAKEQAVTTAKLRPAIRVLSPKNGEVIEEESIYLAALVTDYRKLENVTVKVNGANVPLNISGMKRRDIRTFLPLKEGNNTIVIRSYNADNLTSEETINVTRIAEVDVDVSPFINNDNPDAVGVVIGISYYKNIASADFAARDARAVKDYLIHAFGFNKRNILEAFDGDATNTELRTIFEQKLADRVKPGKSDLFVYYSGHGVPSSDTKQPYIVPYDADTTYIETQGYLLEKLYKDIDKLQARSVTVVIDSCFSGQSEKGLIVTGISPLYLTFENPAMQIKNGVVFTSSKGNQVSSWYSQKQHGLFTYYFLLGLRGAADSDNDSRIDARELGTYLSAIVSEKARYLNSREQTPTVVGNKDMVLLKY